MIYIYIGPTLVSGPPLFLDPGWAGWDSGRMGPEPVGPGPGRSRVRPGSGEAWSGTRAGWDRFDNHIGHFLCIYILIK